MPIFAKHFILDVWQGSEYYSGLLKLFYRGSKRDKQESWYMPNWLQYSLQMKNFPLFWSHAWKYNIQANKRLTKIKEKRSTIKLNVFVLTFIFFHLNVPDNKCQNKSGMRYYFLTRIKLVVRVLLCVRVIARIKCRRLFLFFFKGKFYVLMKWIKNCADLDIQKCIIYETSPFFDMIFHLPN